MVGMRPAIRRDFRADFPRCWNGKATPITQPAGVREVVEKFRAKYGADEVAKYYSKFDVAAAVPLA